MRVRLSAVLALAAAALLLPALAHAANFDVNAATDAYLATVTGEAKAKSDAYFEGGYWLILWDALVAIAACLVLLFFRVSSGMRSLAERWARWRWLQTALYGAFFTITFAILSFPMTIYEGFYREHAYGLSNLSLPDWLAEHAKGLLISTIATFILLPLIYGAIRKFPRSWPFFATTIVAFFILLQVSIAPVFIEPLFNTYKPMDDGPLKESILSLARANGVPAGQVFQVDASRQSDRISANVSGFLGTTRIALNDNLLRRGTPAEIKAVMGHEMGHFVLNHIVKIVIYMSLVFGVGFLFAQWGFGVLHGAFGGMWGVRDIGDQAGLPIIIILFTIFSVLATPVQNSIIRENESQADIFGLNAVREPDAFATAILKLAQYRKLDPTPLEEIIFYDHPSGRTRVHMAMQWKAEHLNDLAPDDPAGGPAAVTPPESDEPVPQGPDPDAAPVP
ncbi:MAG: M48 family metalloprotease [Alphaproteobacteria bacterium]|nr:M48 family metalloprotease [Alphaproteobacteria bacterium]